MFIMFGMLSCHSGLVGPEAILSLLPRMEGRAFWASCPAPPHPIPSLLFLLFVPSPCRAQLMQLLQEKPCWKDNDNKCRGVIQLSKIATRRTSVCWNLVVMELMHFIYQLMSVPRKRILLMMDFNHVHSTDFGGISHQPYFSTCANAHGIQSKHK